MQPPPATEVPNTDPTFATELPTESPVETFVDVVETVYAVSTVNVRTEPNTDAQIIGSLNYGESVQRTGIGNKGWSRVTYNGVEAYVYASYLSITKEWYEDAWCYIAHLQFTDYTRFGTACANGEYDDGYETTSHAASRLDAIFAVNGCYSAPYLNYTVVRGGEKGCIFGVPLDGGGSSTMVFQGKILNSAKAGQRSVVDFLSLRMNLYQMNLMRHPDEVSVRDVQAEFTSTDPVGKKLISLIRPGDLLSDVDVAIHQFKAAPEAIRGLLTDWVMNGSVETISDISIQRDHLLDELCSFRQLYYFPLTCSTPDEEGNLEEVSPYILPHYAEQIQKSLEADQKRDIDTMAMYFWTHDQKVNDSMGSTAAWAVCPCEPLPLKGGGAYDCVSNSQNETIRMEEMYV